jgi:hypothetical protein
MKTRLLCGAVALVLAAMTVGAAAEGTPVISGTVTAVRSSDPGFAGLWKYCITLAWDVTGFGGKPHGLSHLSLLPGLDSCIYICRPGYFAFADTIGTSTNEDSCLTYYSGKFNCKGDPTLPNKAPALKFEPYGNEACDPGVSGTANFCLYSPIPPRLAGTYPDALWIKFGQDTASGPLVGTLPDCGNPTTAVEATTWGAIKALLR